MSEVTAKLLQLLQHGEVAEDTPAKDVMIVEDDDPAIPSNSTRAERAEVNTRVTEWLKHVGTANTASNGGDGNAPTLGATASQLWPLSQSATAVFPTFTPSALAPSVGEPWDDFVGRVLDRLVCESEVRHLQGPWDRDWQKRLAMGPRRRWAVRGGDDN